MKKKIVLIGICMIALLAGCSTTRRTKREKIAAELKQKQIEEENRIRKYYIGRTRKQLIIDYGSPDSTEDDGDGGKILTYENSVSYSDRRFGVILPRMKGKSYVTVRKMWFAIDKNNIIYSVGFRTKMHDGSVRYIKEK